MKRILWLNIWTKSAKQIRGWKINYDTIEIALLVDTVQLKFQLLTNYKWLPKDLVTDGQKLHSNGLNYVFKVLVHYWTDTLALTNDVLRNIHKSRRFC
jgi:hypothetical protein